MSAEGIHREHLRRLGQIECYLFDATYPERCDGRLQAHHLIPRQRLKWEREKAAMRTMRNGDHTEPLLGVTLDELVADGRNGVVLCKRHHQLIHSGNVERLELPADEWPLHAIAFLEDYGLEHLR